MRQLLSNNLSFSFSKLCQQVCKFRALKLNQSKQTIKSKAICEATKCLGKIRNTNTRAKLTRAFKQPKRRRTFSSPAHMMLIASPKRFWHQAARLGCLNCSYAAWHPKRQPKKRGLISAMLAKQKLQSIQVECFKFYKIIETIIAESDTKGS